MFKRLKEEVQLLRKKDPAFKSVLEAVFCYPGLKAIRMHKKTHWLYNRKHFLLASILSQYSRWRTGIEIHPGAQIGERFFIDHGMGVVIGETAIIGNDVMLYHGVTLGATAIVSGKRHPTIEDGVTISAGAKVLGDITVGRGSKIGAGSVVVKDVPPECTVVGIPGKVIIQNNQKLSDVMADPISQEIKYLKDRVSELEKAMYAMTGE